MATITAYMPIDMSGLNFYLVTQGAYQSYFSSTYVEVDWAENGIQFASGFSGSGFALDTSGNITAGTVTGYLEGQWNGSSWSPVWSIAGISTSAPVLYQAFETPDLSDDFAVIQANLAGNDAIYGSPGSDTLYGFAGNDVIVGGAGNDVVFGGDGNDYIYAGAGNDLLIGGAGLDVLLGEDGNDVIYGGTGFNYLFGGSGSDVLIGSEGLPGDVNVMYGGDGSDYLYGGQGTNYFYGGAGVDAMFGGSGLNIFISSGETQGDFIYGGSGQNYVYGSNGGDIVTGGSGTDVFLMGAGADVINGGGGVDYVWGGGGSDTFTLNDIMPEVMVIQDFNAGGVNDVLNFAGTSLHSFADVQAASFYSAGINTTIITDAAGNADWLIGVAPGQLNASMVEFS